MIDWAHALPTVTAAFLASLVEFVEALTIVLAVGSARGWKHAMVGTAAGALSLTCIVLLFGPVLHTVPMSVLRTSVGVLLCLFGMRWLRKAILRAAGIIAMHDEDAIYQKQIKKMGVRDSRTPTTLDLAAAGTAFNAVVIEGLEVVFIVIATGSVGAHGRAGSMIFPASLGAAAAGILVIVLGLLIHKPLSRIPENLLKFSVGVMLSAFGVFWVGEGLNYAWPGEDLSLAALVAGFALVSLLGVGASKRGASIRSMNEHEPEVTG